MLYLQPYRLDSNILVEHGYLTLNQIIINHKEKYIEFTTNIYLSKEDYINGFAPVQGFPEIRGHLNYENFTDILDDIINWFVNTVELYSSATEEEIMGNEEGVYDAQLLILKNAVLDEEI